MSDIMLHGVLNMPPELWNDSPIDVMQRHSRYIQASKYIYELNDELTAARAELAEIHATGGCSFKELHRVIEQRDRLAVALSEIEKRGANPITQYGYGTERPWSRLADDVWKISRNALSENAEVRHGRTPPLRITRKETNQMKTPTHTAPPVDLDRLVRLFPIPWERDVTKQEVPPERLTATIYAADSTRICETKGEHAADLAQVIVDAVNNYLPNADVRHGAKDVRPTQSKTLNGVASTDLL